MPKLIQAAGIFFICSTAAGLLGFSSWILYKKTTAGTHRHRISKEFVAWILYRVHINFCLVVLLLLECSTIIWDVGTTRHFPLNIRWPIDISVSLGIWYAGIRIFKGYMNEFYKASPQTVSKLMQGRSVTGIMVADSDVATVKYLVSVLALAGFQVEAAVPTSQDVLTSIYRFPTDVIILEAALGDEVAGIAVAKEVVRTRPLTKVVFMVDHDDPELIQEARLLKPAAILLKPFTPTELINTLDEVVGNTVVF